jgi:sigma-B regulation protein RsbU (phosphoserine phosphatase)
MEMETIRDTLLRAQLLDRRRKLESAIAESRGIAHLVRLLQQVDSALEQMDKGSYGLCDVCREPVEEERLLVDPLIRTCLDHLTPDQRRALEQDLDLASRIQGQLLPQRNLRSVGWEVYYHYEAVGSVSGDYCDLMNPEPAGGDLFFLVGDVAGKGVAASMLMAHLHAIFRSLIPLGLPVDHLIGRANRVFCESTSSAQFATLVCGRAGKSGEVEVCNAGHCPPLLVRAGEITSLEATGVPIGIFSSADYSVKRIQLAAGDGLLLYTDGLSEARDRSHNEYGAERLARLMKDRYALAPQALVSTCLEDLKTFQSGTPRTDDLTLMAVRRVV